MFMPQARSLLETKDVHSFHEVRKLPCTACLCISIVSTDRFQGQSALAYGVESGDKALVQEIIDAKADVNSPITEVRAFRGQRFGATSCISRY